MFWEILFTYAILYIVAKLLSYYFEKRNTKDIVVDVPDSVADGAKIKVQILKDERVNEPINFDIVQVRIRDGCASITGPKDDQMEFVKTILQQASEKRKNE